MNVGRNTLKKYITQYMINKGSTSTTNLLNYCKKISSDEIDSLEELIKEINSNICGQLFSIEFATCEITNEDLVIWSNKRNDVISRNQIHYTKLQLEYFQAIFLEILNSSRMCINYVNSINISSSLTRKLSLHDAEIILMELIRTGYFVVNKWDNNLYLGARTIVEFRPYLNKNPNRSHCGLCNELVFMFKQCSNCEGKFHSYCLQKYFKQRKDCPKCKNIYNETSGNNSSEDSSSDY